MKFNLDTADLICRQLIVSKWRKMGSISSKLNEIDISDVDSISKLTIFIINILFTLYSQKKTVQKLVDG